jgi:hypothetical protein
VGSTVELGGFWFRHYFYQFSILLYAIVSEIDIQQLNRLRLIRFGLGALFPIVDAITKFAPRPFHFVEVDHPDINLLDFLVDTFDNIAVRGDFLAN